MRLATKEDFDRDQAKHEKADAARKQIRADHEHRDILAGLFPDDIRPTVMLPSSNQPGQFNLEFYNVDEKDIRKIAELLKSLRP